MSCVGPLKCIWRHIATMWMLTYSAWNQHVRDRPKNLVIAEVVCVKCAPERPYWLRWCLPGHHKFIHLETDFSQTWVSWEWDNSAQKLARTPEPVGAASCGVLIFQPQLMAWYQPSFASLPPRIQLNVGNVVISAIKRPDCFPREHLGRIFEMAIFNGQRMTSPMRENILNIQMVSLRGKACDFRVHNLQTKTGKVNLLLGSTLGALHLTFPKSSACQFAWPEVEGPWWSLRVAESLYWMAVAENHLRWSERFWIWIFSGTSNDQ